MERRVLLAITLSFLVLFLFQRFVMPPPAPLPSNASAPAAPPATASQPLTPGAQAPAAPGAQTGGARTEPDAARREAEPVAATTVGEASAREIIVETSKVKAV